MFVIQILIMAGANGVKLLGVPSLTSQGRKEGQKQMGKLIADATCQLLDDWNCTECISSMVFDTTAANTGNFNC